MNAHTKFVAAMAIGATIMFSAPLAGQVAVPQGTQTIVASPPYDMSYGQQYAEVGHCGRRVSGTAWPE